MCESHAQRIHSGRDGGHACVVVFNGNKAQQAYQAASRDAADGSGNGLRLGVVAHLVTRVAALW